MTVYPKSTVQISASTRRQIMALSAQSSSPTQNPPAAAASYQHMAQTDNIYIRVSLEIGGFRKKLPSSHQVIGKREDGVGGKEGGR